MAGESDDREEMSEVTLSPERADEKSPAMGSRKE